MAGRRHFRPVLATVLAVLAALVAGCSGQHAARRSTAKHGPAHDPLHRASPAAVAVEFAEHHAARDKLACKLATPARAEQLRKAGRCAAAPVRGKSLPHGRAVDQRVCAAHAHVVVSTAPKKAGSALHVLTLDPVRGGWAVAADRTAAAGSHPSLPACSN